MGRITADNMVSSALAQLTSWSTTPFAACELTNATICPALEAGQPVVLVVWNQQAQVKTAAPVRLSVGMPSGVASWGVYDNAGAAVTAQLLPLSTADAHLRSYYSGSKVAVSWLAFTAASLPAVGYSVFFLVPSATAVPDTVHTPPRRMYIDASLTLPSPLDSTITNGVISVTLSAATGLVASYANAATGINTPLSQTFVYYRSSAGNKEDGQASGAYIFRPNVRRCLCGVVQGLAGAPLLTALCASRPPPAGQRRVPRRHRHCRGGHCDWASGVRGSAGV